MPPKAQVVTVAELGIMKLLWQCRDPLTAREIREQLYPAGTPSDHATVQKLLQRLEAKCLIVRDRSGFAHRFAATVTQAEIVGGQLQALAESMVEGSMVPVLSQFIRQQHLTPEERRQLHQLLEVPDDAGDEPDDESGVMP
jgi:BlaI family penicillinase repressor